jgi:hypothetical protein
MISNYLILRRIRKMQDDNAVNAENLDIDSTLEEISRELKADETLVLDIGNNFQNQSDVIYDTLVLKGYNVKKMFRNGKNQIIVSKNKTKY